MANKKTFILRLAGLLILFGSAGVARAREAEYVPERAYLDTVIREIKKARESVTVGMYMFTLRGPGGGALRHILRLPGTSDPRRPPKDQQPRKPENECFFICHLNLSPTARFSTCPAGPSSPRFPPFFFHRS